MKNRKGFVIYIVIAMLLGLAILAFALSSFKMGAVTQLSKNVDQNRLIQYCKSANAEYLACIRSLVNKDRNSKIYRDFRSFFTKSDKKSGIFSEDLDLFSPNLTIDMAKKSGYEDIKIKSWAKITTSKYTKKSAILGYEGYLDVFSKAYRDNKKDSVVEIHERHDVRFVDLRHYLDKYALFVRLYSDDLNNYNCRVVVEGVDNNWISKGRISRVYLGVDNYKPTKDKENRIYLDLNFDEIKGMPGFKNIFGNTTLTKFSSYNGKNNLFYQKNIKFDNCFGISEKEFYQVYAVKKVYEEFMNNAAYACLKQQPGETLERGSSLKSLCDRAISAAKSNNTTDTAAYRCCVDYSENFKTSNYDGHTVDDYSSCSLFKGFLSTCFNNWHYEYGYLDANSVWILDKSKFNPKKRPYAQEWTKTTPNEGGKPFSGLTESNYEGEAQAFFEGYKEYNSKRSLVGTMLQLYGKDNKTPVLVEGPVNLRFFKIAFFPSFEDKIPVVIVTSGGKEYKVDDSTKTFRPEYVPILYRREDKEPKTFQSIDCDKEFSTNSNYFSDKSLMSKAIDTLHVNALILDSGGSGPSYYDGDGNSTNVTLDKIKNKEYDYPAQPSKNLNKSSGIGLARFVHQHTEVTYKYNNSSEFLNDRLIDSNTLSIDGVMYIEKGNLDLSSVTQFYGTGLIYLNEGNVTLCNLRKMQESDTLRLYLRNGDFIIGTSGDVRIEASLAALYFNSFKKDFTRQGSIKFNKNKKVEINGNLLVDKLFTQDSSNGLADGGELVIIHDPYIVEPSLYEGSPALDEKRGSGAQYQISIGKVKTVFSINAGASVD